MRSKFCLNFCCLLLTMMVALSGRAFSSDTYVVAGPLYNCVGHYAWVTTINQALSAVKGAKHAVIDVCPGVYTEQLVITQNLTLIGVPDGSQDKPVIAPPITGVVANTVDLATGLPIAAQILVQNTAGPVLISNLTVDGTGNGIGDCNTDLQGIRYENGSGTVNHVLAQNQVPGGSLSNCATGEAMVVQTSPGKVSKVEFEDSSILNYNQNGITGTGAGTTMTAIENYVTGSGVVPGGAVQNGIELGYGATGKISLNTVTDNLNDGPPYATDILLIDTAENSSITVASNILGNSQIPLGLETDFADGPGDYGDGVSVTSNKIFGVSTYDGIDVCTNGNKITNNLFANSVESGVHLDASCGANYGGGTLFTGNNNTLTNNTFLGGSCAGVLADSGTTGNTIGSENFYSLPLTIASSTSSCTLPAKPARAKAQHRFNGVR